ncbi:MAG: hypothetical protein ABIG61_16060 [Planctomycetota bacterium]
MAKSKDVIKQIRKATRRKFSADEKIRIVLEGFRVEGLVKTLSEQLFSRLLTESSKPH